MSRQWVKGWNGGLTGPNTPCTPTVAQSCANHVHYAAMERGDYTTKGTQPHDYYIPIADGMDTVAIAVGPDREATADLIIRAPRLEAMLLVAEKTVKVQMERIAALESTLQGIINRCREVV